jgi:hypothetical protein
MPPFEGAIGCLADLTFIGRHRSGRDDDAPLAVRERIESGDLRRGDPQEVEAADQIDLDDAPKRIERQRTVATDDPSGGADAGAIDGDARRAVPLTRRLNGRFDRTGVGHIAADREPAYRARRGGRRRLVDVQDRNLDPRRGQRFCRCLAETGGSAADDCRLSRDLHVLLLP